MVQGIGRDQCARRRCAHHEQHVISSLNDLGDEIRMTVRWLDDLHRTNRASLYAVAFGGTARFWKRLYKSPKSTKDPCSLDRGGIEARCAA